MNNHEWEESDEKEWEGSDEKPRVRGKGWWTSGEKWQRKNEIEVMHEA